MQILGRQKILKAYKKHAEWSASLRTWTRIAEEAEWRNFVDVRNSWRNSDVAGPYVIFDIANNRARLITVVDYGDQQVIVNDILTHAEYDRKDFTK